MIVPGFSLCGTFYSLNYSHSQLPPVLPLLYPFHSRPPTISFHVFMSTRPQLSPNRAAPEKENQPLKQYLHHNFPTVLSPPVFWGFHPFRASYSLARREKVVGGKVGHPSPIVEERWRLALWRKAVFAPQAPTWEQRQADGLKGAIKRLRTYLWHKCWSLSSLWNEALMWKHNIPGFWLWSEGRELCNRNISKELKQKHRIK